MVGQTGVATGVPQFSTTTAGPDEINLGNLNVHWSFPIIDKPGRGLPFKYALGYDNSFSVFVVTVSGQTIRSWQLPVWQNPFTLITGSMSSRLSHSSCAPPQPFPPQYDDYDNWVYTDPSGGRHEFPGAWTTVAVFSRNQVRQQRKMGQDLSFSRSIPGEGTSRLRRGWLLLGWVGA